MNKSGKIALFIITGLIVLGIGILIGTQLVVVDDKKPVTIIKSPIELTSNLSLKYDKPFGNATLKGYLVEENEESYGGGDQIKIAYFAFTNDNKILTDWIRKWLSEGNTLNRFEKYPMFRLGCDEGKSINGSWLKIASSDYEKLKNSSESNQVTANFTFGDIPDVDGSCLAIPTEITF